jgi:hypothetical protein
MADSNTSINKMFSSAYGDRYRKSMANSYAASIKMHVEALPIVNRKMVSPASLID